MESGICIYIYTLYKSKNLVIFAIHMCVKSSMLETAMEEEIIIKEKVWGQILKFQKTCTIPIVPSQM